MPGNKFNGNSNVPTSRISRLLELRQLKRTSRASLNEVSDNSNSPEPGSGHDFSRVEQYLEDAVAGSPPTQRLLVVANRLPVSAVRRGEDSWSLEISAGGLVSALLGNLTLAYCSVSVLSYVQGADFYTSSLVQIISNVLLLKGVKEFEARWIGWAGVNVPDEVGQKALTKALAEKVWYFDFSIASYNYSVLIECLCCTLRHKSSHVIAEVHTCFS